MVLVIDDEETLRDVVGEILALFNLSSIAAGNGHDGIALFKEHQDEIDLILLDMHMPVLSGHATLRTLRELDSAIKIILMSGYPESSAMAEFRGDAHLSYLAKPFTLEKLTNKISEILGPLG
ncbi:MAG: response regulator [Caldilineaceae bacterium]